MGWVVLLSNEPKEKTEKFTRESCHSIQIIDMQSSTIKKISVQRKMWRGGGYDIN